MQQAEHLLSGKVPVRNWANEHRGNNCSQWNRHKEVPNVRAAHLPIEVTSERYRPTSPNRKLQQVCQLQSWVNKTHFVICHAKLLVVFGWVNSIVFMKGRQCTIRVLWQQSQADSRGKLD
jgi:hypothetical protein